VKCWICGGNGNSGEHLLKASALRAMFRGIAGKHPLYIHNSRKTNRRLQSEKSDFLKSPARICARCNDTRTQKYDFAFDRFHDYICASLAPVEKGKAIDLQAVFPGSVVRSMRRVQLYFVKVFGCAIKQADAAIPLAGFAESLLSERARTDVYIAILPPTSPGRWAAISDLETRQLQGRVTAAGWILDYGTFGIRILYASRGVCLAGMADSWHPTFRGSVLRVAG